MNHSGNRLIVLTEDTALDLLTWLFMMSATLDKTRPLLKQARRHLPGELAIEAADRLSDIAFIEGVSVGSEN